MKVYFGTEELPLFQRPVLTIGTFDGVHKGHKQILRHIVARAKEISGTSILISFEPHPRKLIFPDEPLFLLSTMEERLDIAEAEGIDVCVVVPFTHAFAGQPAKDYIENFLLARFHPHTIVIGYDHRFGADRSGNIDMLKDYAKNGIFSVTEIPAQLIDASTVSSTQIRKALIAGDVKLAAKMLGHAYSIQGKVGYGKQLGRTIGFPTANVHDVDMEKLIPADGVYAVWVDIAGKRFAGMLNIGVNPTVDKGGDIGKKIEVNIFDFDRNIYGQPIRVALVERIRNEQKFGSVEELQQRLAEDKRQALQMLGFSN